MDKTIAQHLKTLLLERTLGGNLRWASDEYEGLGDGYGFFDEVRAESAPAIVPRHKKSLATRALRGKSKSEFFTPGSLTKLQTDLVEEELVAQNLSPKAYIDKTVLEVACGQAPYIVARTDAVTGAAVALGERWGALDRKLRVASFNSANQKEFLALSERAFKAVYAFEWSADSLFLARCNMLLTFIDFYKDKFGCEPDFDEREKIATIISWNIFQMDGTTFKTPTSDEYALTMDWEEGEPIKLRDIFFSKQKSEGFC